jgi:hypothetical protein
MSEAAKQDGKTLKKAFDPAENRLWRKRKILENSAVIGQIQRRIEINKILHEYASFLEQVAKKNAA